MLPAFGLTTEAEPSLARARYPSEALLVKMMAVSKQYSKVCETRASGGRLLSMISLLQIFACTYYYFKVHNVLVMISTTRTIHQH